MWIAPTKSPLPIYNPLYSLRNGKHLRVDDFVVALYFKRFEKLMSQWQPKVIVSVFPTGAEFAASYKSHTDPNVFLCTIITDVVASWEWIHPQTDCYGVPTMSVRSKMLEKNIPEEQLYVIGVPVKREHVHLSDIAKENKNATPSDFKSSRARILLVGSAMGRLSITDLFLEFIDGCNADFDIVTGKDHALYNHLTNMTLPRNVALTGFATDLPERMRLADIIVTKPGGATLFEAIEHELPLIAFRSSVAQEGQNAKFIETEGIGLCYRSEMQLIETLRAILDNPHQLKQMKANMQTIKKQMDLDRLAEKVIIQVNCEQTHSEKSLDKPLVKRRKSTMNWMEKEYVNEVRNLSQAFKARRISNRK